MTNESDSSIDELLSADLDGETSPAEHERIEAQPELRSRREELRAAAAIAGGLPEPLAPDVVDHAIGRALAQSDAGATSDPQHDKVATLRRRTKRGPAPWLVAAAVILLAATGIGLIVTAKSPQRQASTASSHAQGRAESKASRPPAAANSTTTPTSALDFIGSFASPARLRSELAGALSASSERSDTRTSPQLVRGQADRCATVVEARDPRLKRSNRQAALAASIAGEPVVVLEYRARAVTGTRTTTRVIAVGAAACDERVNFER